MEKNKIKTEVEAEVGNEESHVNSKKLNGFLTKRNIIIAAIAVVVIIIVGLIIMKVLSSDKFSDYPIAYVEDEKLILYDVKTDTKIVIDEEFSLDENSNLIAAFPYNSNDYFAYINDETLYLYNVKKESKEKISAGMKDGAVYFSPNNQYIIYKDEDNNIYSYNIKKTEKSKILSGNPHINTEYVNNYLYILDSENNVLYVKNVNSDKEKEKIVNSETNEISNFKTNEDGTKVIYEIYDNEEKDIYSVYVYDAKKGEKTRVLTSILGYETNDNFTEFIYAVRSKQKINLLDDDELGKDPITTVTGKCTYSDYQNDICTFYQWYYEEEIQVSVSKKETNDEIREYAKDAIELYDIYYKKGLEDSKLLVEASTGSIRLNVENKTVTYKKISSDVEKVKISTLKSLNDYQEYLSSIKESFYYSVDGNEAIEMISSDSENFNIYDCYILNNGDIYIVLSDDNDDLELYYYNKASNKLVLLDEEFNYLYSSGNDYLIYLSDYSDSKYTFKRAKGSEILEIASDSYSSNEYNDFLLILGDCDKEYNCTLYKYNKTKVDKLVEDVNSVQYYNDDTMYLFKNYSYSRNTYDIYSYRNGKTKSIAFDIKYNYIIVPTSNK